MMTNMILMNIMILYHVLYLFVKELHFEYKYSLFGISIKPEVLAAFLLAINPFHIYYSQEFRSYMLMCLLGTLSVYYLKKHNFKLLTLANVLLFYTHYSSIFLIRIIGARRRTIRWSMRMCRLRRRTA